MNRRPDPRPWIAGVGAVAVVGAVVAGYLAIDTPGQVRAQRLDEARLETLRKIAAGAQCAYTFTGRAPASLDQIRTDFLERRIAVAGGGCTVFELPAEEAQTVSYRPAGADHVILCAEFSRPSPRDEASDYVRAPGGFPEFAEPRPAAGRHCYRVRLVNQSAAEAAPSPKEGGQ